LNALSGLTYCWIRAELFSNPGWFFYPTIAVIIYRAHEVGIIYMNLLWTDLNDGTYGSTEIIKSLFDSVKLLIIGFM